MYKAITILFIACFLVYLPFSRTPDVFDSVKTEGIGVGRLDPASGKPQVFIRYTVSDRKNYTFDPSYLFLQYKVGEKVPVLYEESHPQKAAVDRVWGYWVSWKEILSSLLVYFLLFQLSLAMVKNPAPETEKEQEEYANRPKGPKYNGNTF